jgi:hypothetical protein
MAALDAREKKYTSDSTQKIGQLDWEIVECASGTTVAAGNGPVLAKDIVISEDKDLGGSVSFDKCLHLDKGFSITMAEFPEASRADVTGFGITADRDGEETFSWEWFDVDRESHAVKRQESGDLEFSVANVGQRWEVARTTFASDVSLRIDPRGGAWRNKPTWRIKVRKGSYVIWPAVLDGRVITPEVEEQP